MHPFTIITPTGDRPDAIRLCAKYVDRQTVKPTQWIVVDDGEIPIPLSDIDFPYTCYVRREKSKTDSKHTLPVQIKTALKRVTTDYVLIMEDDDWYDPCYAETMLSKLFEGKGYSLVGQGQSIYYHISGKFFFNHNKQHASLCQTAFRSSLISRIETICNICTKNPFLDIEMWKMKVSKLVFAGNPICIGMKGLPGRKGTTMGWKESHPLYVKDTDYQFLRQIIGSDAGNYISMYKETCSTK